MKNIKKVIYLMMIALAIGCQDDDHNFGEVTPPSNLTVEATIANTSEADPYGDGSGVVHFTATADNAINYKYIFGDNTQAAVTGGDVTHAFTLTGVNEYVVTVVATGTGGAATSATTTVTVYSQFEDPQTKSLLTGDSSKTWYVAAAMPGHLGVGPVETATPDYYAAAPFEKEGVGCFYDDELTFSLSSNGNIIYNQDNKGTTFFNVDFLSVGGGGGDADQCLPYDTSGAKFVNLSAATSNVPADATTGTQMMISDNGFMSYYIGTSTYEILEITDNYLYVRAIPGSNPALAWYIKFTTDPEGGAGGGGGQSNMLETQYNDLVWSAEFDGTELNTEDWNFETGNNNGWGNDEVQYYTEDNTAIEDGVLKITAKAESTHGFDYSSSRITTMGKHEFKYGRIEVRAKLPEADGTWPAIWMLGANFPEVNWPQAGEIDIMEQAGNDPNLIHGSLHYPDHSGGDAVTATTTVDGATTDFHNYTVEWSADKIIFAVDDKIYQEFQNTSDTPFNSPFFVVLNLAMGGTFGGTVDPAFSGATFAIDYVRVYQ